MKRSLLFFLIGSFSFSQLHADNAALSSQFLKLLMPSETIPVQQKPLENPQSQSHKTKKESEPKKDDQKFDPFLLILTIHENSNRKLYRADLESFNFKYINYLEYGHESYAFPAFDEKKLTKDEKAIAKKYGKLVAKGYEVSWYLQYIDEQIGHGAFADEDIEKGEMIGEYTGIIIERTQSKDADVSYGWCLVAPEYQRDSAQLFFVDARKSGNFTRFINHSFYPNIDAVIVYFNEEWHMVYVAAKPIKKGEQLLVNYGMGYWRSRSCNPVEMGL